MAKGIIGQLQLLGTVVLAAPVALLGADFLLSGKPVAGVGFLVFAVLMVAVEEYITKPTDVATDAAKEAASAVVETPDDESSEET